MQNIKNKVEEVRAGCRLLLDIQTQTYRDRAERLRGLDAFAIALGLFEQPLKNILTAVEVEHGIQQKARAKVSAERLGRIAAERCAEMAQDRSEFDAAVQAAERAAFDAPVEQPGTPDRRSPIAKSASGGVWWRK